MNIVHNLSKIIVGFIRLLSRVSKIGFILGASLGSIGGWVRILLGFGGGETINCPLCGNSGLVAMLLIRNFTITLRILLSFSCLILPILKDVSMLISGHLCISAIYLPICLFGTEI